MRKRINGLMPEIMPVVPEERFGQEDQVKSLNWAACKAPCLIDLFMMTRESAVH
jgi:hypothetical protein